MNTEKLSKILKGFELYILGDYDKYMEEERNEDAEYNSGISSYDTGEDFYAWVDSLSHAEMLAYIEGYAENLAATRTFSEQCRILEHAFDIK